MEGIHQILAGLDEIETLVLRVTAFLSVLLVCAYAIWNHIKQFKRLKKRKRKPKKTVKENLDG